MKLHSRILGCLLGAAIGDAAGLRREGLSRRRAARLYGNTLVAPSLFFGRGFCSDDTEHTQIVGFALAKSAGDQKEFERVLASELKKWFITVPVGIGFGTLRACVKLLLGYGPCNSGVNSAGNGPAMRSALLGLCATSEINLTELVRISTRITHTDPRAEAGALLVAQAARLQLESPSLEPVQFIHAAASSAADSELRDTLGAAAQALIKGRSCREFCDSQGWSRGVSGYVNHTVPTALCCWARSPNDFRQCITDAVTLGGDADTVGAIAGAICGSSLGCEAIPSDWTEQLAEWPRTTRWMRQLADALTAAVENNCASQPPSMHWVASVPRNFAFGLIVILLALRRFLPPY